MPSLESSYATYRVHNEYNMSDHMCDRDYEKLPDLVIIG